MPNHVKNTLSIHCADAVIMNKIKAMILGEDEEKNQIITMRTMLPPPNTNSRGIGYKDYGYEWRIAAWGTEYDIYDYTICCNGENAIIVHYCTAWKPNFPWVSTLCRFIQSALCQNEPNVDKEILVEHKFNDFSGDCGGIMKWFPSTTISYEYYNFMEYTKLHELSLYNYFIKTERGQSL